MKYLKLISFGVIIIGLLLGLFFTGLLARLSTLLPRVTAGPAVSSELSNQDLQAQIISLESEVSSLLYLKAENERLKSAILTKQETKLTPIAAQIVFFDNDFTRSSAVVNVGAEQGVKQDQAVIIWGHIVGQVKEVNSTTSTIVFLNDKDSKLVVSVQKDNPVQGVLKTKFGTSLMVDLISKLEPIEVGQAIVTVPTDRIPGGLRVGSVKKIQEGELFHAIEVDYPISFYGLSQVFILKT